ncbi:ATP-grasp domain-containing protein [Fournierella massiliensis]|nr:ATP-grasp domain-containing protein [Fournierella massiliensis]MCF2557798.1 ATP-grasp domain-containing protein [Fournierella massiliensis]
MKRLAVIGASYLQLPLIEKAKSLGYETHVFAWQAGDVGEEAADVFHPISILEKEAVLEACRPLGLCGVCTIGTDLGAVTANYVAHALGLPCNSPEASFRASNKHAMRRAFEGGGDPSPRSVAVRSPEEAAERIRDFVYPIIVKPTDRSGSRAITRLESPEGLEAAVKAALAVSFEKQAVVEEYAEGVEYSVECASQGGHHHLLAITRKYTTGAPHFIETGHIEPAPLSPFTVQKVRRVAFHALDSLGITDSISHTELKIRDNDRIALIEIGGRMGGDCIGTHLVPLTTGVDFVKCAIDLAVGNPLDLSLAPGAKTGLAMVRFVLGPQDLEVLARAEAEHPDWLVEKSEMAPFDHQVEDSGSRYGYFILRCGRGESLSPYLPGED